MGVSWCHVMSATTLWGHSNTTVGANIFHRILSGRCMGAMDSSNRYNLVGHDTCVSATVLWCQSMGSIGG